MTQSAAYAESKFLSLAYIPLLFLAIVSNAPAATVTTIPNIEVGGTYYTATIHTSGSFNSIWIGDGKLDFGEDTDPMSLLNREPMFWGDKMAATEAAEAVMERLGEDKAWSETPNPTDYFAVPFDAWVYDFPPLEGVLATIRWVGDSHPTLDLDSVEEGNSYDPARNLSDFNEAYVSFETSPVPLPAAAWLFGSGLLGFIGLARRKKAAA